VALIGACLVNPAFGQVSRLALEGPLDESLSERVRVSGFRLVGLHLGSASGRFLHEQLSIVVPSAVATEPLCLRLASRDGRYRALAPYRLPDADPLIRLLDFPTRHATDISRLPAGDMAARLVISSGCNDLTDGVLVPLWLRGMADPDPLPASRLTVMLNLGEARASAVLKSEAGDRLATAACPQSMQGSSVTFTHICQLELAVGVEGRASLEITTIALTRGRSTTAYAVLLPRLP
jgi:hypothetical protein